MTDSKNLRSKIEIIIYKKYLNDFNNFAEYLLNKRGLNNSTYTNRYNLLRRTLIKLYEDTSRLINATKIIEAK